MSEREFWLRVIMRAQEEAAGMYVVPDDDAGYVRYMARKWLTVKNKGFEEVCEMAGLTDYMARKLREKEQAKWRTNQS